LLEKNNKFIQPYENEILIDRFDKNNDGIINYNEFTDEITPKM
jgi:Ca2+-binding EF-hand superfamily protein